MRFFGVLTLRSPYTGYGDVVGLRNSHDKKFPIGIGFGSKVFVCDNLALVAEHVVKRKHTMNAKRDLPGLIGEIVEPLQIAREKQHQSFLTYQATPVSDEVADHAVLTMYRQGIINVQRIADVLEQWEHPVHDWGDRTAWRLFNGNDLYSKRQGHGEARGDEPTSQDHRWRLPHGAVMHGNAKRKYALADFSVEYRPGKDWYFGGQLDAASSYRGPYKSIPSVTLMIAKKLRKEIERRDQPFNLEL